MATINIIKCYANVKIFQELCKQRKILQFLPLSDFNTVHRENTLTKWFTSMCTNDKIHGETSGYFKGWFSKSGLLLGIKRKALTHWRWTTTNGQRKGKMAAEAKNKRKETEKGEITEGKDRKMFLLDANRQEEKHRGTRAEREAIFLDAFEKIYESNSFFELRCFWIVFCHCMLCFRRMWRRRSVLRLRVVWHRMQVVWLRCTSRCWVSEARCL